MEQQLKTKNLLLLVAVALVLGLAYMVLFFEQHAGVNFPILILLMIAGGLIVADRFQKKTDTPSSMLFIPIVFFAIMVFMRASPLLSMFNILGSLLLLGIVLRSYVGKSIVEYLPVDYLKVFLLPFRFIVPLWNTLTDTVSGVFNASAAYKERTQTRQIVRGVFMSVVALVVFAALFAAADATFARVISNMFSFIYTIDEETLGRIIMFLVGSAFFIGALGYMVRGKKAEAAASSEPKPRAFGALEATILLSSINVLFLIFIVLQLAHLFGGGTHVVSQGITYAEYARKGFFELILVAIMSYLIISTAEKQIIKHGDAHLKQFKILSTILIVQVLIILVSAFARLALYEATYGFTTIRLYSHALMIWLAAVLILLSRHILTGGTRARLALQAFGCVIVLLVCLNVLNPDAFIAKKNIDRYHETGKIDTRYLANLSVDALPFSITLLSDMNPLTQDAFARDLYFGSGLNDAPRTSHWQSFHLSRMQASKILFLHAKEIEIYKNSSMTTPPAGISTTPSPDEIVPEN